MQQNVEPSNGYNGIKNLTENESSIISKYISDIDKMDYNYMGLIEINDLGDMAEIYKKYIKPNKEEKSASDFRTGVLNTILSYVLPKEFYEIVYKENGEFLPLTQMINYGNYTIHQFSYREQGISYFEETSYILFIEIDNDYDEHMYIWKSTKLEYAPKSNIFLSSCDKWILEFNEIM